MITLFDENTLPTEFETGGRVYKFHSDFREWIRFEMLVTDKDIPEAEKDILMQRLIFPEIPPDIYEVKAFLLWFYRCGKPLKKIKEKGKAPKTAYSFEYDDGYIYAAFLQAYGIDLSTIPYLHWWKFHALFSALPEECKIVKIMGYRTSDTKGLSDDRKKFINEMQEAYKLPKSLSEQQMIEAARKSKKAYEENRN